MLEAISALFLILSAAGVILAKKPVYSALFFLLTLLLLAFQYLNLSANFLAVMQILVYAGAILVMFMFVMILFQDAHAQLAHFKPKSSKLLQVISIIVLLGTAFYLSLQLKNLKPLQEQPPAGFGTVQSIGHALYVQFFFPFEAITLLFLIAVIGALYIGRKST